MDDTIYRQDAVDAIWEVKVSPDGEIFNAIKRAQQSLIEALPSAQQNRIQKELDGKTAEEIADFLS